jgi:hypothetical protein
MFRFGLHMGLDKMSSNELADCFNALCLCREKEHSPDYLKKLRTTIRREFEPGWALTPEASFR